MARRRTRWTIAAVVAATLAVVVAWAVSNATDETVPLKHKVATADYLPGVGADVFLPASATRAPVVVLVPGGSWRSADRTGLGPLADTLAEHNMVVVNASYRAADDGVRFPVPVADVVCAIDFAVYRARQAGIRPGPVIVLGHSAGGHLAALAALAPQHFRRDCPFPPVQADGLIGLAGAYDVMRLPDIGQSLFGVTSGSDPALWREGDPTEWVTSRPQLPVLLAHGSADQELSQWFTNTFAEDLKGAGHPVQVSIIDGATHGSIYTPDVIAATVIDWIDRLAYPVK